MAKTEIIKNDAVTVRVNAEPVKKATKAVANVAEKPVHAAVDVLEEVTDTIEQTLDILEDTVDGVRVVVRNNPVVLAGVAVVAAGVGAFVAWTVCVKKTEAKYEKILAEQIAEAKEFYRRLNKVDEFETPGDAVEALVPGNVTEAISTYRGRQHSAVPYNDPEKIVPQPEEDPRPAVSEVVKNVFDDAETTPGWDMRLEIADREANPGRPYVISFEEHQANEEAFEQVTLTYYEGDKTLADEREQIVDNTDYLVGEDNLLRFGHGSHDPNVVYVRNDQVSMDFEIALSKGTYAEEVAGVDPEVQRRELRHSGRRSGRTFRGTDE